MTVTVDDSDQEIRDIPPKSLKLIIRVLVERMKYIDGKLGRLEEDGDVETQHYADLPDHMDRLRTVHQEVYDYYYDIRH